MRSENMSKSLLTAYHITKILFPYRKSRSLNTIVTADLGPEIELTLFLRMRQRNRHITGNMYTDRRVIPLYRKLRSPERMAGLGFWPEASK